MATATVAIHAQACVLRSHDHKTVLLYGLGSAPLLSFIERCAPASDSNGDGQPLKRRRIDSEVGGSHAVRPSKIPVAKIALNLDFDDDSQQDIVQNRSTAAASQAVDVRIHIHGSHSFGLSRQESQRKCSHVEFQTTSELPESVLDDPSNISTLQKRAEKSDNKLSAQPVCQLKSLATRDGVSIGLECAILLHDGECAFGALGTRAGAYMAVLSR